MILKNLSRNKILTLDLKICTSISDSSLGLLNPKNPRSLLFKTRFGLHTFGLKQTIDVLVLDGENKVVMAQENLQPNRLFFWNPLFDRVIELPKETLKQTKTVIGDQLELSQETFRT